MTPKEQLLIKVINNLFQVNKTLLATINSNANLEWEHSKVLLDVAKKDMIKAGEEFRRYQEEDFLIEEAYQLSCNSN